MRFYQTLLWKGSVRMFLSLAILATVQSFLLYFLWNRALVKSEQLVNLDLAASTARRIQPLLLENGDYRGLRVEMTHLMDLLPKAGFYILDSEGKILDRFTLRPNNQQYIDLEPIESFLAPTVIDRLPIYGTDPERQAGSATTFSVAPLQLFGSKGYLYVTLRSPLQRVLFETFYQRGMIQSGGAMFGFSLILCAIFAFYILRYLTRRFSKMAGIVISFGGGDFSQRLPVTGSDDVDQMARAINTMADSLASHISELNQKDTRRRELIANVSHDLRGPIAVIDSHVQKLLKDSAEKVPDHKTLIDVVQGTCTTLQRSIRSLETLLEQLFELGRLEARETQPEMAHFSLTDLLLDIELGYLPLAESQGIKLQALLPERRIIAFGDAQMMARVFQNLIENSLRFTGPEGSISVLATVADDRALVEVSDTGIGMPESALAHVFERSYQIDAEDHSADRGLAGLGLAIVKQIIELHHGKIGVKSSIGVGTTFTIEIPLGSRIN